MRPMRWDSSVMPIWWRKNATIGTKSFSDQGSGSADGGGGSMPDVATLNSLTVQQCQRGKHPIHVKYEQEPFLVTDEPSNKRGGFAESQLRRRLYFLGGKLKDV